MNKAKDIIIICLFLFFLSCNNQSQDSWSREEREQKQLVNAITGKVIGISDGDTFKMLMEGNQNVRVRLYGVDAPERAQDYGTQARQALSNLIFSKTVQVERKSKDRYGRIVGIVHVDGINVNEELLMTGMVWQYTNYDKSERWSRLQEEAKTNKRGLWAMAGPIPPWQFRKEKRTQREAEKVEMD